MAPTQKADALEGPDAANVAAIAAAAIGAGLALGALALYGTRTALSVGAGATIAVANLVTMSAIIRALLQPPEGGDADAKADADADADADAKADADAGEDGKTNADHVAEGKRGGAAWGLFAVVKILVLFGGIWILLTRGMVDPIPLVVGYGVLPMGIAASSVLTSLRPRSRRSVRK